MFAFRYDNIFGREIFLKGQLHDYEDDLSNFKQSFCTITNFRKTFLPSKKTIMSFKKAGIVLNCTRKKDNPFDYASPECNKTFRPSFY